MPLRSAQAPAGNGIPLACCTGDSDGNGFDQIMLSPGATDDDWLDL